MKLSVAGPRAEHAPQTFAGLGLLAWARARLHAGPPVPLSEVAPPKTTPAHAGPGAPERRK